jgi:xylulose-5-phosphate/fructose-6-phosphate phosphoketolase
VSHAIGAAFRKSDLIVALMVDDGEAEAGLLVIAWHSNRYLDRVRDSAPLPVRNGHKIANPTILAKIPRQELEFLFRGYGCEPYFVEGSDPAGGHQAMVATLKHCVQEIRRIQRKARRAAALNDGDFAQSQGMDRGRRRPTGTRSRGSGGPVK